MAKMYVRPRGVQSDTSAPEAIGFEIFLQSAFSELESSSVVSTLEKANRVATATKFSWKFVSDKPGLIVGRCGTIARAEPAVFDHNLSDYLVVVGGGNIDQSGWMQRVRAMHKRKRPVVILSDAATAYIKALKSSERRVTTHWQDVGVLQEIGYFPALSTRYSEYSGGVFTSAGANYTSELTAGLIASFLSRNELAELCSQLIIQTVRHSSSEQPKGVSYLTNMFEPQLERAIRTMEENPSELLSTTEIANLVGVSVRHLERLFSTHLNSSPGRYYRKIRLKKAHSMIVESEIELIEIALANGFASVSSLSSAYRKEFGASPTKVRFGERINLFEAQI